MSIIFSKSCEYGIQSVLYIAKVSGERPVLLKEISTALNIPHHFLSKILQTLTKNEIVISHKGFNGGFELAKKASEINIIDVVRAIDGESYLTDCVLGFPDCSDNNPCPVHNTWSKSKNIILDMLHNKTVEKLSKELDGKLNLIKTLTKAN